MYLGNVGLCVSGWVSLLFACGVGGKFLWLEEEPLRDECTIIVKGSKRGDLLDYHPPAHCRHGGYIHYANWGRVHLYIYLDLDTKQEFKMCLTTGLAESTYIWYDYCWKHWEPMTFPAWHSAIKLKDQCRNSINGTIDLYLEPPWWYPNYVAYFSWNITEIEDYQPKPWRRHARWGEGEGDEKKKPKIDVSELVPRAVRDRFKNMTGTAKQRKKKKKEKKDKKKKKSKSKKK